MIQSDNHDPIEISTLGQLREYLAATQLPDSTPIQVEGDMGGDEVPLIVTATRTWRPNEQGCMVVFQEDGSTKQVDEVVIVIREWSE